MSDYRMPAVRRGEIVDWYEGGVKDENLARPAIVLVATHGSLHLKVFDASRDFTKECVKHVSDPNIKEHDRIDEGCWDFVPPVYMAGTTPPNKTPNKDK
jgi:hypothetical protein